MKRDKFFGTDDQREVVRRGRAMAALFVHDLRSNHFGRTAGLVGPEGRDMDRLANLATI